MESKFPIHGSHWKSKNCAQPISKQRNKNIVGDTFPRRTAQVLNNKCLQ